MHSKILLIGCISLILCAGLSAALTQILPENDTGGKIGTCLVMMNQLFMWFGLNYVSTVKVTEKNVNPYQETVQNLAAMEDLHSNSSNDHLIITLDLILTNEKCINLFMQHLSREYSMESLLGYIELTQFVGLIVNDIGETVANDIKQTLIPLPNNIPLSKILSDENQRNGNDDNNETSSTENSASANKWRAYRLYEKYIAVGSELEINISGAHRTRISNLLCDKVKLMNNDDAKLMEKICDLFDSCRREMRYLMEQSFARFKKETEYNQIKEELNVSRASKIV